MDCLLSKPALSFITLTLLLIGACSDEGPGTDEAADTSSESDTESSTSEESSDTDSSSDDADESDTSSSDETESGDAETESGDAETESTTTDDETSETETTDTESETSETETTESTDTETTDGLSCGEIEFNYEALVSDSGNLSCVTDDECHVVFGHCDVGLGGCWYVVNQSLTQAELDALAFEYQGKNCFGAICLCLPPPNEVGCVDGFCSAT